jgi:hypothetical protein
VSIKQKTMKRVVGQFHRPHGLGGRAAGWVMAHRGSNRRRNVWAVGLLDVQLPPTAVVCVLGVN